MELEKTEIEKVKNFDSDLLNLSSKIPKYCVNETWSSDLISKAVRFEVNFFEKTLNLFLENGCVIKINNRLVDIQKGNSHVENFNLGYED